MQSRSLMTLLATTAALWGVPAHSARDAHTRPDLRRTVTAARGLNAMPSTLTVWPSRSPAAIGRAFVRPTR